MSPASTGVAVVSGAGSGIGLEIALALAARGHRLALIGRRRDPLEEALARAGGRGRVFPLDVRELAPLRAAASEIETELGAVDVVVPAAGISRLGRFVDQPAKKFDEVVEVNLLGAARTLHVFLPPMLARGRGALVPILSVAARQAFPEWSA
jgi:NADP-dependent 3-hydroxy acid dehydrogenase YdfG